MFMKERVYESNDIVNKERIIDENLMRKIIITGGRCLKQGWEGYFTERSLEEYIGRCNHINS